MRRSKSSSLLVISIAALVLALTPAQAQSSPTDGAALFKAKCAMCHGPQKFRPPDVDALLKANYPHDRANDYTNGDLRGFYWAEVSKVENTQ